MIITIIPSVNNNNPRIDFLVNFSFNTKDEKSIVNKIDNFVMLLTPTGLAESTFNEAYSNSHAPPVASPLSAKNR